MQYTSTVNVLCLLQLPGYYHCWISAFFCLFTLFIYCLFYCLFAIVFHLNYFIFFNILCITFQNLDLLVSIIIPRLILMQIKCTSAAMTLLGQAV